MKGTVSCKSDKFRLIFRKTMLQSIFEIVGKENSLKEISLMLGVPYYTLKKWRYGINSIPCTAFELLKQRYPGIIAFENQAKKVPYNYGAVKGGNAAIRRLSRPELLQFMENVRRSKHNQYSKINISIVNNRRALEFFGIMMGDGCLSEYYAKYDNSKRRDIKISGNSNKDREYMLNYVSPLTIGLFKVRGYISLRKDNTIDLNIRNKPLFDWMKNCGFPVGKKGQHLKIPKNVMKLSFAKLKYLIRGLFDTDGCISARKGEGYRYPYVSISSKSVILRKQLKEILRKNGFPAYNCGTDVGFRGQKNFIRWFNVIGSKNPRNLNRYYEFINTGRIITKGPVDQR